MCSVAKSCLTLSNPMDYNPPGSFVHGISQTRVLEWAAISFSKGSFRPRDQTLIEPGYPESLAWQVNSFTTEPPRKPPNSHRYLQIIVYGCVSIKSYLKKEAGGEYIWLMSHSSRTPDLDSCSYSVPISNFMCEVIKPLAFPRQNALILSSDSNRQVLT